MAARRKITDFGKWFDEHTFNQPSKFPGDPKVKQGPPIQLAGTKKKRVVKKKGATGYNKGMGPD